MRVKEWVYNRGGRLMYLGGNRCGIAFRTRWTASRRDAFLGAADVGDVRAGLGRNKLFMPGSLAHDGTNLWVGEFKSSTRILRFSPRTGQ